MCCLCETVPFQAFKAFRFAAHCSYYLTLPLIVLRSQYLMACTDTYVRSRSCSVGFLSIWSVCALCVWKVFIELSTNASLWIFFTWLGYYLPLPNRIEFAAYQWIRIFPVPVNSKSIVSCEMCNDEPVDCR